MDVEIYVIINTLVFLEGVYIQWFNIDKPAWDSFLIILL